MARGFDSKSVESQQAEAFGTLPKEKGAADPARSATRHRLELAKFDAERRLRRATGTYKEMLLRTIASLDEELAKLQG
jgi:hypothetical protein